MSLKLNSNSINYNVATVLDLTSIVNPSINDTVVVTEEGRGGVFIYRADGTSNGGTIFDSSSTGKWHRQYEGSVNVKWFGAKGDGVTNDLVPVQNALYFIRTTQDITSYWYSDKIDSKLLFPSGTYLINGTLLTIGNVIICGDGADIISSNNENTPVFETAYISEGIWTSNALLETSVLLSDAVTNLKFENLTFRNIGYVFKLRGAIWQGHISKCSFYYCGIVCTANNCFYFNYLDIMSFGTKGTISDLVGKFQLTEANNRISFDRVSIAHASSVGAENGIGIQISGGGGDLSITNCSFEIIRTAIQLTDSFSDFTISSCYFEGLYTIIKDTDGAIKNGFNIDIPVGNTVSDLIDGSGFRNTIIQAYCDVNPDTGYYRGVVKLNAGTNGNRGTKVYMDSSYDNTINTAKYLVTSDVELIPNDYQLIHGSNSNGTYTKFPDGTLIQYISKVIDYTAYVENYIALPTAFKDTNYGVAFTMIPYDQWDPNIVFGVNSSSGIKLRSTITASINHFNITIIGRWK